MQVFSASVSSVLLSPTIPHSFADVNGSARIWVDVCPSSARGTINNSHVFLAVLMLTPSIYTVPRVQVYRDELVRSFSRKITQKSVGVSGRSIYGVRSSAKKVAEFCSHTKGYDTLGFFPLWEIP
jgi:hypothetical protein